MLLPWRWTLGDRPFIDEENLGQISSLPMYPFAKFFALMRGSDVTGFVLYNRLLCLLMVIAVAVVVFIVIRHVIRWEFALLIATLPVSFLFWEGPQLTYVTMATSALTVAAVCGVRSLLLGEIAGGLRRRVSRWVSPSWRTRCSSSSRPFSRSSCSSRSVSTRSASSPPDDRSSAPRRMYWRAERRRGAC